MPICKNTFGCSSGNRSESHITNGRKNNQSSQNEQARLSELDHDSEFTTAAWTANKPTSPTHKPRLIQSGISLFRRRLSMEAAFKLFSIALLRKYSNYEIIESFG